MNLFRSQIDAYLELLNSPVGIIGMAALLMLMFVLALSRHAKWAVLTALLFIATLGYRVDDGRLVELVFPLEQFRSYSRLLVGALLLALLVPTLLESRSWRPRWVLGAALMYFLFQMMFTARMFGGGAHDRALLSLLTFPVIFLALGIGVGRWIKDWADARSVIRCIAAAGVIFLVATCYQLAINPSASAGGGRLFGITPNPQVAAMLIGSVLPAMCYLIARRGESKLGRLILIGSTGFLVIFLLWTGSRTGVLMALVGITLLFRVRLGRFLLVGAGSAIFVLMAMQIYTESVEGAYRVFTLQDTRTGVWKDLWQEFTGNPFWGTMKGTLGVQENSYLATAATSGLFGLVPLLLAVAFVWWTILKLQKIRRQLGEHALLSDLVTASLISIGVGAAFEGILLGTMTVWVFLIYIYLGVAAFLLDMVENQERVAIWEAHQYQFATPEPEQWSQMPAPEYMPQSLRQRI